MRMMSKTPIRHHRTTRYKKQNNSMKNLSVFALVVFVAAGAVLGANAMGTSSAPDFTRKAAVGNEFEVESSKLALQKSQDDSVRKFAQRMIDDHGKAGDDLASAVSNANMEAPDTSLDTKHQKILNKLNNDSGASFDKDYIKAQVKAHNETISLFKDYAKHGDNDSLKTFASNTLPTLKEHKQMIDQINSSH